MATRSRHVRCFSPANAPARCSGAGHGPAAKRLTRRSGPTNHSVRSRRKRSVTPNDSQNAKKLVQHPIATCWQLSMASPVVRSTNDDARPPNRGGFQQRDGNPAARKAPETWRVRPTRRRR